MSDKPAKKPPFTVVWEFRVKSGKQRAFEKAYGTEGVWVQLFRRSRNYLGTELIRDHDTPLRYRTLDRWNSRAAYDNFRKKNREAYQRIDAQCEALTTSEKLIGEFDEFQRNESNSCNAEAVLQKNRSGTFRRSALQTGAGGQECLPHTAIAVRVRPATSNDIAAIVALERASPSAAHWPETAYRQMFSKEAPVRIALVAEKHDAELHGFVVARLAGDDCELENIVVSRKRQRCGTGTKLLQELIASSIAQSARCIFLEVRESNAHARGLYEKLGFAIAGRRPAYYSGPSEDAILYTLQL
jgi:ribosomal-protein-alanine acetyltransferase